jgi:NADH:ubiquinone oxidoreductase subunit 6 (subunit J)
VLLKGTVPIPITSTPLVLLIYVVMVLMLAAGLASVLLRNLLYAIAAFMATMVLVALLYLLIAPFLLFAIQLLVFTTVAAVLTVGLVRRTTGLDRPPLSPFGAELLSGAVIAAALLALLGVVAATTAWPVRVAPDLVEGFGTTLTGTYVVGLATLVVLIASAALGASLLATQRLAGRARPSEDSPAALRTRRRPRPGDRA